MIDYQTFETNWMNGDRSLHGSCLWFDKSYSRSLSGIESIGRGFAIGFFSNGLPKSLGSISIYNTQTLFGGR